MSGIEQAVTRVWQDESRLATVITWIAVLTALIVAISVPTIYLFNSLQSMHRDTAMTARLHAVFVTQLVIANPAGWKGEVGSLLEADLAPTAFPEHRMVMDDDKRMVAETGERIDGLRLTESAPIIGAEGPVGEVVVTRSLEPMARYTTFVALFGMALGASIFVSLRILPLRALQRALAALKREERKAREEAQEHLRVVFQNAVEGIAMFTPEGSITSCNPAMAQMFRLDPVHLQGMKLAHLLQAPGAVRGGTDLCATQGETMAYRAGGEAFPVDVSLNETRLGGRPQFIAIIRDITERKQAETRLSHMANYDSLTGLPNRSLFRDRLEQAMARALRQHTRLALMFLDLDRFKTINDTLGHEVGDQLLKHVANALSLHLRATDSVGRCALEDDSEITVSRLGGDEFTVIAEGVHSAEAAAHIARRILGALAEPFEIRGDPLYISTSIGVTLYPDQAADLDGLVKQADLAMYRAKERGRNTFFFYNDELNREMAERHALEASLRQALDRNEFCLHFQPKANLSSGEIVGVEALLRWVPLGRPSIGPDRFVPILEDIGLIAPVGEWVLREACAQIAEWRTRGVSGLRLAVNFSARQFRQEALPELIARVLAENGLDPCVLEVELTESILMEDSEEGQRILSRLAVMGINLAIDDFGTGHSSLAYLKRFNVHTLKIDRSFVQDIPDDPEDSAIAQAIIGLAASLGIRVVAEGVETQAQADFLRSQGCDEMQGYLLSRPLPPAAFVTWIQAYRAPASSMLVALP